MAILRISLPKIKDTVLWAGLIFKNSISLIPFFTSFPFSPMKTVMILAVVATCAAAGASCNKTTASPQSEQTCPDEKVLAVYQNREAVITMTQKSTYCLIVDSAAIAAHSYRLDNYLVPSAALPVQYQVEGLHVIFSGRKKSCYGLTTFPDLRNVFGYKLDIDVIQSK